LPALRGNRTARHRVSRRRRDRDGATLDGRADDTGGAGRDAWAARGDGHRSDAAREAARPIRRHHHPRDDGPPRRSGQQGRRPARCDRCRPGRGHRRYGADGDHHTQSRPRRRLGGAHSHPDHERNQRAMTHESTAAWRELLETLGGLDASFLTGERAVTDDRHIADGYRMLATTLGVAFDTYLFPDPSRPRWIEVNSPSRQDRRWGGDNTDAYYFMCPVDAKRRYRISGNKGDSVYFSVTAYNEPSPGAWSDRIVAILRDDDLA